MKNRAIEICSDSGVVSYALSSQPDGANYHTLILLQERLLNQMLTVQDEIALYLYLGNIDKAISAYTIYDNAAFERELGNFCELSQDEYRELLNRKYLNSVLALDAGDAGGKTVAMLTGVPMAGAGEKAKGMFMGVDKKLWYNALFFLLIVILYYISTGGIHMDDIKSPSAVTIGELSRIVKEFEEKIQNGTEDPDRFLTLTEIEELWGKLIGDTNVLYSDMLQSLIQNIDERELVRQKKENSRPEE